MNGDDPEAVVHVARIAIEFRQQFKKDVVVDMFCYRRHGHNEADEPAFTQPLMYRKIAQHPTTRTIYAERLVAEGVLTAEEAERMVTDFLAHLETQFEAAKGYKPNKADWLEGSWSGIEAASGEDRRGETGAPLEALRAVGTALTRVPDDVQPASHPAPHPRQQAQDARNRRRTSTGRRPRRSPSARCWSKARRCGSRARIAAAAPSRTATRC